MMESIQVGDGTRGRKVRMMKEKIQKEVPTGLRSVARLKYVAPI